MWYQKNKALMTYDDSVTVVFDNQWSKLYLVPPIYTPVQYSWYWKEFSMGTLWYGSLDTAKKWDYC